MRSSPRCVAALACIALAGCGASRDAAADDVAAAPKKVKCTALQSVLRKDAIEVRGTVAPLLDRDAQIAPQVAGRVLALLVHEGDAVVAGQVIARVDDAAAVDAAHQTDAAVARARAEFLHAQTTLAREQRVFEHGIVPKQEVDDAAAREAAAKAAQTESEAAAHQAHRQIERAIVRSPIAGVVLKVLRKQGELVDGTPATPVAEVADTAELELVADVPAQDIVRLALRATATVTCPALPDQVFAGKVSRVAPSVDRTTGVGAVRIAIERNAGAAPPIGIFGIAQVESGEARPVMLVSQNAVRALAGRDGEVVVCGADHKAHVRKVRVAAAQGGLVALSGELAADERVAVEPVLGLAEGDTLVEAAP